PERRGHAQEVQSVRLHHAGARQVRPHPGKVSPPGDNPSVGGREGGPAHAGPRPDGLKTPRRFTMTVPTSSGSFPPEALDLGQPLAVFRGSRLLSVVALVVGPLGLLLFPGAAIAGYASGGIKE